jgi:hypothetical protein
LKDRDALDSSKLSALASRRGTLHIMVKTSLHVDTNYLAIVDIGNHVDGWKNALNEHAN